MDETRRFIRYVIPGLSFIFLVLLFMWLIIPDWTIEKIKDLLTTKNIGIPISALLISTGIGFIFGIIHHQTLWCCPKKIKIYNCWLRKLFKILLIDFIPFNFTIFLNDLKNRNYIKFYNIKDNDIIEKNIDDRFDAWKIICGLLYSRLKTNCKIESIEPRADSLINSAHSMGTARIAFVSAIIVTFLILSQVAVISFETSALIHFVTFLVVCIFLLFCHKRGYQRSMLIAQKFIEQVLADVLINEAHINPIKINISSDI